MSEKQVMLITLAVLAIVLLGGGAAIYYLNWVVLAEKEEQRASLQKQVDDGKRKRAELKDLEQKLAQKETEAEEKGRKIPNEDREEYDRFIKTIEKLQRQSRVFIWSAKHVEERSSRMRRPGQGGGKNIPKEVRKVDYEFVCNGQFYSLLRFVNLLETDQRFMEVQACDISVPEQLDEESNSMIRQIKVKLSTYAYEAKRTEMRKDLDKAEAPASPSSPLPE